MIVKINDRYVITLVPESQCEKLALAEWERRSKIPFNSVERMLEHVIHPLYIGVDLKSKVES